MFENLIETRSDFYKAKLINNAIAYRDKEETNKDKEE